MVVDLPRDKVTQFTFKVDRQQMPWMYWCGPVVATLCEPWETAQGGGKPANPSIPAAKCSQAFSIFLINNHYTAYITFGVGVEH